MNYRVDDLLYGYLQYKATYNPNKDRLYITSDNLRKNKSNLSKCEFYLPSAVQSLIESGECDVRLFETPSKWMGVTYRDDSEAFSRFIKEQRAIGNYPPKLWK